MTTEVETTAWEAAEAWSHARAKEAEATAVLKEDTAMQRQAFEEAKAALMEAEQSNPAYDDAARYKALATEAKTAVLSSWRLGIDDKTLGTSTGRVTIQERAGVRITDALAAAKAVIEYADPAMLADLDKMAAAIDKKALRRILDAGRDFPGAEACTDLVPVFKAGPDSAPIERPAKVARYDEILDLAGPFAASNPRWWLRAEGGRVDGIKKRAEDLEAQGLLEQANLAFDRYEKAQDVIEAVRAILED